MRGGFAHLWRNNDDPAMAWSTPTSFGNGAGVATDASVIQSNYGNPGNLEMVARINDQLVFLPEVAALWRGLYSRRWRTAWPGRPVALKEPTTMRRHIGTVMLAPLAVCGTSLAASVPAVASGGTVVITSPTAGGVLVDGGTITVQANPGAGSTVVCVVVYLDSKSTQLGYNCAGGPSGSYVITPGFSLTSFAGVHNLIATLDESDSTTDTSPAIQVVIDPGEFRGVTPYRELDTRYGTGLYQVGGNYSPTAPVPANGTLRLAVSGGGIPSSGVAALALNVTVADPTSGGFITAFPDGQSRPIASNLNFAGGQVIANLVTLGTSGGFYDVDLYNGSPGSVDLIADVVGYYTDGSTDGSDSAGRLHGLVPARLLDTRYGTGGVTGPIAGGGAISFQVSGQGPVPSSGVSGVVLNLTETGSTSAGFFTAWPSDSGQPLASSLNFPPQATVPNLVELPLGPSGRVSIFNGSPGSAQAVADVVGYFTDSTAPASLAGLYTPLVPSRILDTRYGRGAPQGPVGARATLPLQVTGVGGVPSGGASSVIVNVTVTDTQQGGYLTVFPGNATQPLASNLNFTAGQTVPNLVTTALSQTGGVNLYNGSDGSTDLVADVQGFYS